MHKANRLLIKGVSGYPIVEGKNIFDLKEGIQKRFLNDFLTIIINQKSFS